MGNKIINAEYTGNKDAGVLYIIGNDGVCLISQLIFFYF